MEKTLFSDTISPLVPMDIMLMVLLNHFNQGEFNEEKFEKSF